MATVSQTNTGKDGVVKSVLIEYHDGTLKRPVIELVPVSEKPFQTGNRAGIVGSSKKGWKLAF